MTKPVDQKKKYQSYLLRLWVEDVDGKQVWRISLEDPFTGERRGFASRSDLCAYLEEKMDEEKINRLANKENQK
jgi:ethanolamine ammonia-lyase large subunit